MRTPTSSAIAVAAAALLLAAGCTAGTENEPGSESADDPVGTDADVDANENGDAADPANPDLPGFTLGEWVQAPPETYFVTGSPGMALLATGEQTYGEVITRDVTAYDAAGEEVWSRADVREFDNLPEAASAGDHVALIDVDNGAPALRGLAWADGAEVWTQPVGDLLTCTDQVSVQQGTHESVLADALGSPCAGAGTRTVAVSIDAATGEVRGEVAAGGEVTGTASPDGSQAWYLQVDGQDVQVHTLELDSGAVGTDVVSFEQDARAPLIEADVEFYSMWPVSDHEVALQSWHGANESSLVLADLESGEASVFAEGEPCGYFTASRDVVTQTCLVYDEQVRRGTAVDFEGSELWTTEGSIGLSLDGPVTVEPVDVAGDRAWLVSADEDLVQARAVQTGEELWTAGAGEGSGSPISQHPRNTDVLVVAIQLQPPDTIVLRLDAESGDELERQIFTDAWVRGDDHVVAVEADAATLLAFVTAN